MEHIKIELDFIPVEERLPEDGFFHPVLEDGQWMAETASCYRGKWENREGYDVNASHWAEIPEIK